MPACRTAVRLQVFLKMFCALAAHMHLMTTHDCLSSLLGLGAFMPPLQVNKTFTASHSSSSDSSDSSGSSSSSSGSSSSSRGLTLQQHSSVHTRLTEDQPSVTMREGGGTMVVLDEAALGKTAGTCSLQHSKPADDRHRIMVSTGVMQPKRPGDARRLPAAGEQPWQERFAAMPQQAAATPDDEDWKLITAQLEQQLGQHGIAQVCVLSALGAWGGRVHGDQWVASPPANR